MSQENVEIVRRFYEALERSFDAYWRNPRSLAAALETDDLDPEFREMLSYEHPEVEWRPFAGETYDAHDTHRGHLGILRAWDEWLPMAEDYRVTLEEATDLGADRVLAVAVLALKGKGSRIQVETRSFTIYALRDGLIIGVNEYRDRAEALEAGSLSE
jgi:ketosteroid isomerase-like protein